MLGPELQSIPMPEQTLLDETAVEVQSSLKGKTLHPGEIRKALRQANSGPNENIVLLHKPTEELYHNGVRIPFQFHQRFKNIAQADNAYGFMMGERFFFGPANVTIDGQDYALFTGRRARLQLLLQRGNMLIFATLAISGLLCFTLAWSFTKPIKDLRDAAQKMAKGDLKAGAQQSTNRQDEIGELSEDFQKMAVKVEELMANQKRLLADISHELRSPLARLQLAIGIAQQNLETDTATETALDNRQIHTQVLQRIEKEAAQIEGMIGKILQLSRLESNTQDIVKHKVMFPSFVSTVLQDASYEAENLGKVLIQDHRQEVEMMLEPGLVASAIENVLRNAIRYAEQQVSISSQTCDGNMMITIEDDGCGVADAELEKLFSPFYRVSLARNRETGGTGLGLAIAIQAINAHNGVIRADNNKKGGLSVEIKLPLPDS